MTESTLSYAVITPARDEVANLPRVASFLASQSVPPLAWFVVENGSCDGTCRIAHDLAARHPWMRVLQVEGTASPVRGAPIVRAFRAGLDALDAVPALPRPDLVVQLDADVSGEPDFFERLIREFRADPRLGIAGGSCFEPEDGVWRQRHVTSTTVHGATRTYRWECLRQVLPLEERLGWDGFDEFKANTLGWRTRTILDLPFLHHRTTGQRDASQRAARRAQGHSSHYMGYRFWYLALRSLRHAVREPAALAMIGGYLGAWARREPRHPDPAVIGYVRARQSLRHIPARTRETFRRRKMLDPHRVEDPETGPSAS